LNCFDSIFQIGDLIHADPRDIIFTSGATESNNLAIRGVASYLDSQKSEKKHVITTQIEHKCVLASCRHLETECGWDVTYLPVGPDGMVDLERLQAEIRPGKTALVSIMMVNNEIGTLQDVKAIGEICRKNKVYFHTDAAQAIGKIPVNVDEMNIDLMSISGHKLYGPKGIGALYIRRRPVRVRLRPLIDGGGQERGLRSGTLPTPLCVGLGKACELAGKEMDRDIAHVQRLADKFYKGITSRLPKVVLNGHKDMRYKGNLNFSFSCVEGKYVYNYFIKIDEQFKSS
jgi:cysteine desulfurase